MLDLVKLDTVSSSDAGAVMEIRHPATMEVLKDDDGLPITITLAGKDSSVYRKAQRKFGNRRLSTNRGRAPKLTVEEVEQEGIELLAACTLAWTGIGLDGKPLECTPQNAKLLFERLPWLREQCDAFVEDRANFLQD